MFSNPSLDLHVSLTLLVFSAIFALLILAGTRKKFASLVIFSVLGNLSFLVNTYSGMFDFYDIKWVGYLTILIWPIINIYLIIKYFQNKNNAKD